MRQAVEETAVWTHEWITAIHELLEETTLRCHEELPPNVYSRELVELIFVQPYCRIEFVVDAGIAKWQTASLYLKKLGETGILTCLGKSRIGIDSTRVLQQSTTLANLYRVTHLNELYVRLWENIAGTFLIFQTISQNRRAFSSDTMSMGMYPHHLYIGGSTMTSTISDGGFVDVGR